MNLRHPRHLRLKNHTDKLSFTRWRNYEQYALYLSVHCAALREDISALVRRYLCPRPQISPSVSFHTPINSANGLSFNSDYLLNQN